MSGYALRLQCQLDKLIKFKRIAHRPELYQAIILFQCRKMSGHWNPGQRSFRVIESGTIR